MLDKKTTLALLATALVLALAAPASTQTPAAPAPLQPGNTVLIAQYECSPAELAKVDQIFKDTAGAVLNKYMAEGKIISWGVLGAYVGGPVNRTIYVWAKDPVSLVQARASYLPEIQKSPGYGELGRLCPRQQVTLSNMILTPASAK
jgi:lipocalin